MKYHDLRNVPKTFHLKNIDTNPTNSHLYCQHGGGWLSLRKSYVQLHKYLFLFQIRFERTIDEQVTLLRRELNACDKASLVAQLKPIRGVSTQGTEEQLIERYLSFFRNYAKKVEQQVERYKSQTQKPLFDFYVVIDFEATCIPGPFLDERNCGFKYCEFCHANVLIR